MYLFQATCWALDRRALHVCCCLEQRSDEKSGRSELEGERAERGAMASDMSSFTNSSVRFKTGVTLKRRHVSLQTNNHLYKLLVLIRSVFIKASSQHMMKLHSSRAQSLR